MSGRTTRAGALPADVALLVARIAIGVIFAAHGWQKITGGVDGTAQGFAAMGVPLPEVAAVVAMAVEFGGGIALAVGFGLPVTGVLLAGMMAGAYVFGHLGTPLFASEGGFELVLALGVSALALGFTGGAFSVDRVLPWGRRAAPDRRAAAAA
ncbi:DoxX family protein [Nocardiopsis trehalosi]|jgi:putative oxidoreductase|uniref:DoxX family protein n=1 Tax=Nocardiopsis trehalosi TaxID=109329 RepID=UPI00082ABE43|nr:DoxX family protein [Nocardiopsis trehalosi]